MSRHLHETANAVLYRALDLPAGDRQQFIAQATAGDSALFDDVRSMLSRIEQLDQFLEDPLELPSEPAPPPPALPVRGELIGRWRVERELGRNGADLILLVRDEAGAAGTMATMRLAQAASRTGQTSARFERLRQRLATLDHPAIPAPIDSGETTDGRPYFVVGRGAGIPIDVYCAERSLDLPARAALFARVCGAVHYMHQHLIVHRDLKPADMLVHDADATDATIATDMQAPAITLLDTGMIGDGWPLNPAYASPDQLAGQPLSVASDIYSLGAVLYSLFSGQLAHGSEGAFSVEKRRAILPPSEAVRAALGHGAAMADELAPDPLLAPSNALAAALQQHIDPIASRALALDPAQRYASAHALAHDLELAAAHWHAPGEEADDDGAAVPLDASVPGSALDDAAPAGGALAAEPLAVAPARRSAIGIAVGMLLAGLVAGAAATVFGLPWLTQSGVLPASKPAAAAAPANNALPGAAKPVALDAAVDPLTARALSSAPLAQRPGLALQASEWQGALSDARRAAGDNDGAVQAASAALALAALAPPAARELAAANAQQRLGASLGAQGNFDQAVSALRSALAVQLARAGQDPAAQAAADTAYTIGETLTAKGDDAGAEAAYKQAANLYAAQLGSLQGDANAELMKALQARLLQTEMARASAQNAQKHGRDTVATLAALHRLPGADGNPQLDLLEAFVQPRGTPAQAYATAQPALEKIKAANTDAQDAGQLRRSALAALMTGEVGLRARQKAPACANLQEAQALFDSLAAAHRDNAHDKLPRERLARAREGCT